MLWRIGLVAARLSVVAFVILTAGYCLLAYIPFTYHQVHLGGLLPWLSWFAAFHPYLYWPVFAAGAWTLPSLRNPRARSLSALFLIVYGGIGVLLLFRPLLVRLDNDFQSLIWCLVALTPLVWLGLLDWRAKRGQLRWAELTGSETRRLFRACLLSALYTWLLSSAIVLLRYAAITNAGLTASRWAVALSWSLACHGVVFMAVFLLLNFTGAIAGLTSKKPPVHLFFYAAVGVVLLTLAFKFVVFVPISFNGGLATVVALAVAFSVVVFLSGLSARLYAPEDGVIESPFALLFTPIRFLYSVPVYLRLIVLVAGSAIGAYLLIRVGTMDWEYLIQKLIVLAIWLAVFSFFYVAFPARQKSGGDSLVIAAAAVVCLYIGFIASQPRWRMTTKAIPDFGAFLDEYANYDASFRLARGVLLPPVAVTADDSLYTFLVSNTNIARSVRTDPVDIDFAGKLTATPGPKPNIFIFVIDSLRRDYLSPYNSAVNFTPEIDAFARESAVAQNAFTHYTGTGLSEPSIWTGALSLHKQYITPFYPMNSLQKLLEFEQYQQFITRDEILGLIMAPSTLVTELDAGRPTMSCELCRSLAELQAKIGEAQAANRPMFAYTQPQNIHVSVINREGRSVPPGESYPGFDAPYASRVKAMDKCFGDFIEFLKSSGLYDNSIVILTSDHGDSLGERGLWGHAYNVVSETVRVPLIIHLPSAMRSLSFDQSAPIFLTDITPSLYYLLGHHPIARNHVFGRPLFTATPEEQSPYLRNSYLIASSYGPVYGLLENSGHSLYVADAVEYTDHLYEWKDRGSSSDLITPEIRADRQQRIREDVNEINRFYNFGSETQAMKPSQ